MLRLLLLRHAKSDWGQAGLSDFQRPLNDRGRQAAPEVGAHMARHGLNPDRILCSSAQRTRETLALLLPSLQGEIDIRLTRKLYDESEFDYLETIRTAGEGSRTLLVVGHNPATQETALDLIGGGNPALKTAISEKYPTAALTVIDFDTKRWSAIEPGAGRVVAFCLPRLLAGATTLSAVPTAANDGAPKPEA
ncbi:SixA phosphatase family protein [Stappia sp.]|jgi:phosphohistidine phosphatase|uniref:SixA phosphatase family protein n=1 Tax=Stappia sp. TaxID=1870903 RepID=UPI003D09C281